MYSICLLTQMLFALCQPPSTKPSWVTIHLQNGSPTETGTQFHSILCLFGYSSVLVCPFHITNTLEWPYVYAMPIWRLQVQTRFASAVDSLSKTYLFVAFFSKVMLTGSINTEKALGKGLKSQRPSPDFVWNKNASSPILRLLNYKTGQDENIVYLLWK